MPRLRLCAGADGESGRKPVQEATQRALIDGCIQSYHQETVYANGEEVEMAEAQTPHPRRRQ